MHYCRLTDLELLPYNPHAEHYYQAIGRKYQLKRFNLPIDAIAIHFGCVYACLVQFHVYPAIRSGPCCWAIGSRRRCLPKCRISNGFLPFRSGCGFTFATTGAFWASSAALPMIRYATFTRWRSTEIDKWLCLCPVFRRYVLARARAYAV